MYKISKEALNFLQALPFLSGFVHLFTNRIESLAKVLAGSTNCITWSMTENNQKYELIVGYGFMYGSGSYSKA